MLAPCLVRQANRLIDPAQFRLVLLDRDGVINLDSPDYIRHPAQWHPLPGAIDAIVKLQSTVTVAVCTNQSGIGRGLFDEHTLAAIHDKLNATIVAAGGEPVDIFYCPHHPDARCPCRKPQPELLLRAMAAYGIGPHHTIYAGDSEKDLLAAQRAECTGALILTGNGIETKTRPAGKRAEWILDDLNELAGRLTRIND